MQKKITYFTILLIFISTINIVAEPLKQPINEIYIAIIIDDFGNSTKDVDDMMALTIPFTGAIIPGQLNSVKHMEQLKELGKGIIIHLPMEAKGNKSAWNTPFSISTGLNQQEIEDRTKMAIDELKYAVGLNNHMGSVATANKDVMQSVIATVNSYDLVMIDSVTTNKSKISEICNELGLNHFKRDVFLDDKAKNTAFVEKRMKEALEVAKEQGFAIAIGHVGPSGGINTVNGIKNMVPTLEAEGVKFVTIEELHNILHGGSLKK